MDIRALILAEIKQKGKIKTVDIMAKTKFSRAYINRFFQELRDEGKIILLGKTNKAFYVLAEKKELEEAKKEILEFSATFKNENINEDYILNKIKRETGIFFDLKPNVVNILEYSFLEMVNNAIEHSKTESINIHIDHSKQDNTLSFVVIDKGVGIFNNLKSTYNLPDNLSAIQRLLKGKQTTDPENHTGHGIFFTSKMADAFLIKSSDKRIRFLNDIDDIFIEDVKKMEGTEIYFVIQDTSDKDIKTIFDKYSNLDTFEFSKTNIKIKLYKIGTNLLSRSQARLIMTGLQTFQDITLDFQDVESIGQAFADEIFRVWQNNHQETKITYINANENVEFMIKRAL